MKPSSRKKKVASTPKILLTVLVEPDVAEAFRDRCRAQLITPPTRLRQMVYAEVKA